MKQRPSPNEWMQDFRDFLEADSAAPPRRLSESILSRVHADLNPGFFSVFLKLLLIHAAVGTFTLLFCPQFGISPLEGAGLMGVFSRFGEHACMLGCGAVFMGGSLLVASLVLRPEEIRAIRKTEILQIVLLALLSIGTFICVGSGVVGLLAVFWALGSVLGGLGSFELGWAIRRSLSAAHNH